MFCGKQSIVLILDQVSMLAPSLIMNRSEFFQENQNEFIQLLILYKINSLLSLKTFLSIGTFLVSFNCVKNTLIIFKTTW